MPENYPQFFTSARGVRMTDVDGKEYIDYMCAFGLNLFGYGDEEINEAFITQMRKTDTLTGVSEVMVDLAEKFTGIVTHADWAIFVKNGTDATTLGAMIARAHTGRDKIIIAEGAYHGAAAWCNPSPVGSTAAERAGRIACVYNDIDSLERAVAEAGNDLAAIFATPFKHDVFIDQVEPDAAYARRARELTTRSMRRLRSRSWDKALRSSTRSRSACSITIRCARKKAAPKTSHSRFSLRRSSAIARPTRFSTN